MPYGQLTFDKGGKNVHWSKNSLFNKWCWKKWTSTLKKKKKRKKIDNQLISHTRINSKWIKDLHISSETIQILEENIGSKISDISCSNIFANISLREREAKEKINKWDDIKLKSFCTAKETANKTKRQPTEWKMVFANNSSDS